MAHKLINGKAVVDWTTGDPEGDRLTLLAAYRDFIKEIKKILLNPEIYKIDNADDHLGAIEKEFTKWSIDTENQIDEVPRIWIKRPE